MAFTALDAMLGSVLDCPQYLMAAVAGSRGHTGPLASQNSGRCGFGLVRVTVSLMGDGYVEALDEKSIQAAVPISILGQATGQASMPFFASLWEQGKRKLFADTVNQTVYRITAASFLASAWMMAAALPIIDLAFRHGHFSFIDAKATATYFFVFAISLALWSAQAQYARAFYGAGDTLTPMIASTIIVVASLPIYRSLFQRYDVVGLVVDARTARSDRARLHEAGYCFRRSRPFRRIA